MDEPIKADKTPNQNQNLSAKLFGWLNTRTGIRSLMRASLDEPIPGGARLAYVFGSGLIFIFISQVITGLCLALYYVPSAESAHTSVAYITKQVAAGQFLRSLHYYGSSAMIIVLALHFLQTFIYGSFKGRRELLWISGAFLSLLVLGMGFTGYLLPWDQSAYFATAVGTNIVGEVPLIGGWLTNLLRGGDTLGTLTLSRFYFAHLFLIPGMIFGFIGIHIALFRKAGPAGPIDEDPVEPKLPPESFYPRQVIMDMAFALLIMVGLGFLAYFRPILLGPLANPGNSNFIPRPEWYYLPMFEWLKFWSGRMEVFAVVIIPGILALLFFLLPFLDRSLERKPWRRPIPLLAVSTVLVGIIFLGFKSHMDDLRDHSVAIQLAFQDKQDVEYTKKPFHPRMESASGQPLASASTNPQVTKGKGVFEANGCSGCHGADGTGTAAAPSLVGITAKYPLPQLTELLHHPNAKMRAGHMPAFDLSTPEMSALFAYLGSLGASGESSGGNATPTASTVPAAPPKAMTGTRSTRTKPLSENAPAEAPSAAPSGSVAEGQKLFQSHACFACHGQAGAGTARVPPISQLIAKTSDAQLVQLLHAPNARMQAGGMPPLVASPEETNSVIAYLRSLAPATAKTTPRNRAATTPSSPKAVNGPSGAASLSAPAPARGSSPAPATHAQASTSPTTSPGRALFLANGCSACHGVHAQGTHFAPSLIGITKQYPPAQLTYLLHHPKKAMRDGGMPPVTVNDTQMQQLVAYLSSLQTPAATGPNATQKTARTSQSTSAASNASRSSTSANAAKTAPVSEEALKGKAVFERFSCETCHGIGGLHGTIAAPGLAGTASLLPAATLENLLRHHSKQMQRGGMPLTNMNTEDMRAVVAYIRSMPAPPGAEQ